jgi:CDP-paratose 2-epimerase
MSARILITGGAGFIGSNLAHRLAVRGDHVRIFDDLSRRGVERNVEWLRSNHRRRIEVVVGDVRDGRALARAVRDVDFVFHLAAQVAVTTSLDDPRRDFDVNAAGTLNVLEAIRHRRTPPPLIFTSTNKVYGDLGDLNLALRDRRHQPLDDEVRAHGISERRPLALYSPYGCSKGAADQYVLDYVQSFGLQAVVLRMSCIYGPRQFGNTDQGWVAHFAKSILHRAPLTIYGDGHQVRDILFVDDLIDAFSSAMERMDVLSGRPFNIGGGPSNAVSLVEVIEHLQELTGESPPLVLESWRRGDQRYYVTDHRAFTERTGWRPTVSAPKGIALLLEWCALHEHGPQVALRAEGDSWANR